MNIKRHLLPATIAAAFHAALFTLIPGDDHTGTDTTIVEVPLLPPIPKEPVDITPPPDLPETSSEPVSPLAGGPTLPSLPDLATNTKAEFTIPPAATVDSKVVALDRIPDTGGIGDGGLEGVGRPGVGFYRPGDLDRTPNARVQSPPDYPVAMRNNGIGGSVLVEFDVDSSGRVTRASAVRYSNYEFVEPALRAVKKWRFEPGKRGGVAVPFRMTVPIEFGMEN